MLSPFLICLTLITGALVQDNQPPKKPEVAATPAATVMVTGRVVYEDTGQPATRHRVQLIVSTALLNARGKLGIPTAMTNERGEFSLRRVIAGEYYVHAGPIDQRDSQLESILIRSHDSAADAANVEQFKKNNLRITVGQHNVEVNLRVPNPHFGSISGMVFDAAHQPAARAMVHVVSKVGYYGRSLRTDDQGRYKAWGLPKGEYTVSASPPSKQKGDGERPIEYQGSPSATYFPSTLLAGDSPPVVVVPDVDTGNVDVTLISRAFRSITGTIRMRGDNRPITNAMLRLRVRQITDPSSDTSSVESPMSHYSSSSDKSGRWSFSNVPDGSYHLFVEPKASELSGPKFVQMEQGLTVDGADIEDLLIEVSEGASVSGSLLLEGANVPLQFVDVSATSHKQSANSGVRLDEAGNFALTAVPTGEILVSAYAYPQDRFYVKSIEANGLDLLRNELTIADGEEIKGVRIVVSTGVGMIAGRVLTQTGDRPLAGVNVTLHRTGNNKPRLWGGKLTAVTDDRGIFTLSAAPGNYLVVAWRSADGPGAFGTAMSKAEREQGTGFTLSPGTRKEIDIRLP